MRTRFAPSPTGSLHVGGLRTALYAWLLARKNKGQFLLRMEDTDQERSVPGAIESILRCLEWAEIAPDEGVFLERGVISQKGLHGPYIQSERKEIYREHANFLLAQGHAYHCFCSKERLEEMRKVQEERHQAPMYDRHCIDIPKEEAERRAAAGEPYVLRMKIPDGSAITVDDAIRGMLRFERHTIDDQVLLKSDGFPTYHLAHVVDDHLMQIDLVLRGEEWLSSLPKHILLFEFFGWTPPQYAHVSLLLNKDRTKLSKRQNAVSVEEYIRKGYLPQALLNFLALLGWNPGTSRAPHDGTGHSPGPEKEIFSIDELIVAFSLDRAQKAGAIFDTEKLDWLQGQWIRRLSPKAFLDYIRPALSQHLPEALVDPHLPKKIPLIQERITFAEEAPDMLAYFYRDPAVTMELLVNEKQGVTRENLPNLLQITMGVLK
ncbi:glutamate--tRNA ligase, partial [Candidatus Peregrinibacteria bacterium]|nr:glutamate--tRNA ligase [Candidatus Peregrinibacteria bacterium]